MKGSTLFGGLLACALGVRTGPSDPPPDGEFECGDNPVIDAWDLSPVTDEWGEWPVEELEGNSGDKPDACSAYGGMPEGIEPLARADKRSRPLSLEVVASKEVMDVRVADGVAKEPALDWAGMNASSAADTPTPSKRHIREHKRSTHYL